MKNLLPRFERRAEAVLPPDQFLLRLVRSGSVALALVLVSLGLGMVGYNVLEHLSWIDSFLNAAMLLGGMGPVHTPVSVAGKLFAGLYALYSGLAVIFVAGVMLAPIGHRILHRFHIEAAEQ